MVLEENIGEDGKCLILAGFFQAERLINTQAPLAITALI